MSLVTQNCGRREEGRQNTSSIMMKALLLQPGGGCGVDGALAFRLLRHAQQGAAEHACFARGKPPGRDGAEEDLPARRGSSLVTGVAVLVSPSS